jgi:hypothetical protein
MIHGAEVLETRVDHGAASEADEAMAHGETAVIAAIRREVAIVTWLAAR